MFIFIFDLQNILSVSTKYTIHLSVPLSAAYGCSRGLTYACIRLYTCSLLLFIYYLDYMFSPCPVYSQTYRFVLL